MFQRQDVDYIGAAGGTGAFRYLVAFDAVDLALIGEEHQIVVGGAGIDVADKVLVTAGHAADSASASALGLIDIQRLAFEVAKVGQGDHTFLLWDEVFDVHLSFHRGNLGAARVIKFFLDFQQFLFDDGTDPLFVGKDGVIFRNLCVQLIGFCLELFSFHASQTSQRHLDDCLCLDVIQTEALHQHLFTFL